MEWERIFLFLVITAGYMVGTAVGFGSAILSLTFGLLLFPLSLLVPVIVPLNLVLCLYLAGRYRHGIDMRRLFGQILPLSMLGMPLGIWLFSHANAEWMKPLFGGFVLFLAGFELWKMHVNSRNSEELPSEKASPLWLIGGGVAQGLWVSGGPLVAYWASRTLPTKGEFRSTLAAVWLILNVVLFVGHLATGLIDRETSLMSMELLPALLVGIVAGEMIHDRLPERNFRKAVYIVLLFAGVAIVAKG